MASAINGYHKAGGVFVPSWYDPPSVAELKAPARDRPSFQAATQLPIASFTDWDKVWQIRSVLAQFEAGANLDSPAMLADSMLRDDRVYGVLATRVGALVASQMEFQGANDKRKAGKIAEELGGSDERPGLWDRICPRHAVAELAVWGLLLGIGVGELVWDTTDAGRWLPALRVWHPQFIRWDWQTRRYYLRTGDDRQREVVLPDVEKDRHSDGQWVIWTPYGYRDGWRRALLRPLAMLYLSRQWAYRDWARYNEKHGMPTDVAMVPEGAPEDEKAALRSALANRGSEASIILPVGEEGAARYDIKVLEATGNSHLSFKEQISKLETDIAICVLGQNLSTEVQGGSRAAAQVHDNVRLDKRREDAGIAACLREQVVTWWARYNHGDPELAPRVRYLVDPPEDELAEVQTLEGVGLAVMALQSAGITVDVEAVADQYGIPVQDPEDQVDEDGNPVAAGAGPAELTVTPSAIAAVTTVNELRESVGLGPLLTENGAEDPDGNLTVAAYQAKHADVVAAAVKAEDGKDGTEPEPPAGAPFGAPANGQPGGPPNAPSPQPARARADAGAQEQLRMLASLLRSMPRTRRAMRNVAGGKRLARYADALERMAKRRGQQALAVDLAELREDIDKATSPADLKRRVVARFRGRMNRQALARVVERANIMAHLAGQLGALEDV